MQESKSCALPTWRRPNILLWHFLMSNGQCGIWTSDAQGFNLPLYLTELTVLTKVIYKITKVTFHINHSLFVYFSKNYLRILTTGFEPVTPPWKGDDLNHLSMPAYFIRTKVLRADNGARTRNAWLEIRNVTITPYLHKYPKRDSNPYDSKSLAS